MRATKFLSVLVFTGILMMGCKKDPELPESSKQEIASFLEARTPEMNRFTISASAGGTITNDSIAVTFPANSFADQNGTSYKER